jgi:predicted regulator of Ras-like GTPase activity (Roadblock/LC7/MglB family)
MEAQVIGAGVPSPAAAEQALAYLAEMSPDVRGGAILGPGGEPLAASGEGEAWADAAAALLRAADTAGAETAEQVHVATEQGEVFALRFGGLVAVTVTERFVLASLMAFDMRAVLRDLLRGSAAGAEPPAGGS